MRIVQLLVLLVAAFVASVPGTAFAGEVVAVVDGVQVTGGDIDMRMRNDDVLRFQPIDSPRARLEALRQLSIEIAVEHAMHVSLMPGSDLSMMADHDRRQKLLGIYEASSTQGISLAPGELDRFIAANPQFFAQRRTWHYHEVVVTSDNPDMLVAMRAKAATIGALASIDTAAMGDTFEWALSRNYAIVMLNRWNSSEQIDPALMKVLEQMLASQRHVHAECRGNTCSFVVLHDVVNDPVDARFGRGMIEETLLARKRALAAGALHSGMLKRAVIEFRDPALAKAAAKTWGLPPYVKAGGLDKVIWVMQASLLLLTLGWAGWYVSKPRVVDTETAIRPRRLAKLDERMEAWPWLRGVQRGVAVALAVLVCGEVVWAFVATSFQEFSHDFAAVAGGSFLVVAMTYVLWRYAPPVRYLAGQLRFAGTGLLAVCGLTALITWAAN